MTRSAPYVKISISYIKACRTESGKEEDYVGTCEQAMDES